MSLPRSGPVIVVRKSRARQKARYHSAWKVAYADFITALMAVFLVLWLGTQETAVRASVAAYFRDPGIFDNESSKGLVGAMSTTPAGADRDLLAEHAPLQEIAQRVREALAAMPGPLLLRDQIEVTATVDTLHIELVDSASAVFFATGSAVLSPAAEQALRVVAHELVQVQGHVVIAGHTDARPYSVADRYSNWELSADRANAARRVMERSGFPSARVRGVYGYADTDLRVPEQPLDSRNRRVSILVGAAP